jgi:endoglucanase
MRIRAGVRQMAPFVVALTLASGSFLPAGPATAAPATAFVRVNQVGYAAGLPKHAFLMASAAEDGATFAVKDSGGGTVYSGSVGASAGSWSNAYPEVYALDFTPVGTPGTYTIEVTGPIPATSPTFAVDTGTSVFGRSLSNSLSFFQNERDGADFIPSPLRTDPAHLNDSAAMTYLTPHANQSGHFKGDLSPLGCRSTRPGAGGTPATT